MVTHQQDGSEEGWGDTTIHINFILCQKFSYNHIFVHIMRAIYLPYIVLLVKKISCKKLLSFCARQFFFNNEIFTNYGTSLKVQLLSFHL